MSTQTDYDIPVTATESPADLDSPSVTSILNNYNFESGRIQPIPNLESVDYIFTEDSPFTRASGGFVPSRGWTDDLCYGTGTVYLTGLSAGGAYGLYLGWKTPLEIKSTRLRVNAMLNACTTKGPFAGNSVGIIAMMYNSFNAGIRNMRGGKDDPINSVAAATTAGLLFKSTAGVKHAAIAGAICGVSAILWQAGKQFKDRIPILRTIVSRNYSSY
ncbi:Tim17/Tim22/Tim23/Pmp24 family-domain-containing protein [Paraphysoderma sedebokerense]|nr:Tim17/Tim22/Tim23/Pmp24 family-domain-containing protein [Paraphysoderma sedebokerense]